MAAVFTCGRCGAPVGKSARACPKCNAKLVGRCCHHCLFAGHEYDFPGNRCPKCGTLVEKPGDPSSAVLGWLSLAFVLPGLYMLFFSNHQSRVDLAIVFFIFPLVGTLIVFGPKLRRRLASRE